MAELNRQMLNAITDPKNVSLALIGGTVPALLWLWFWLKEDGHEQMGLVFFLFIVGMLSVFFVLPVEKFIQSYTHVHEWKIILWAASEEIIKYLAAMVILWRTTYVDEPIKWPVYLITAALGFAALENTLFLIKPLSLDQATVGLLTGQLRFLGSTLLHTVATGTVGIAMGLSYSMGKFQKKIYLLVGFIVAITLHSVFNFFIMKNSGGDFLKVFALLWVVTIIIMLLLEKLRRMSNEQ